MARKVALWPILGMASTQLGWPQHSPVLVSFPDPSPFYESVRGEDLQHGEGQKSEAAIPLPSETSLPFTISTPSSTVSALADVMNSYVL